MKRRIIVFLQIAMLLLMCFPAIASADSTPTITMSLSKTTASVGDSITASGTTASGAWVPLKVVDEAGNIVVFDATKANMNGSYSIAFKVPTGASGSLTVVAGEGGDVVNKDLEVKTGPGTGSPAAGWRRWRRWFRGTETGYLYNRVCYGQSKSRRDNQPRR